MTTTAPDARTDEGPRPPRPGGAREPLARPLAHRRDVRVRPPRGRSRRRPRAGLQHRHPAADGLGLAARGPRLLLHPHRPRRPLPADAGQARLLPDRVGRQRPADRAPRAELLRRALRPERRVRPGLHAAGQARPQVPGGDQPPQLRRPVPRADEPRRAGLRGHVAPGRAERGLVEPLHDHLRRLPGRRAEGVPAQRAARRGVPVGGPDAVGRDLPDRGRAGRARGAGLPRRLPQGGLPPGPTAARR